MPTNDVQEVADLIWKGDQEATKDIMHEGVSTPMPKDLIDREEAKKLASELSWIPVNFLSKFDSLPSLPDRTSMIREMIEKKIESYNTKLFPKSYDNEKQALRELLSEIDAL